MYVLQMKWELLLKVSLNYVIVHVFPGSLSLAGSGTSARGLLEILNLNKDF